MARRRGNTVKGLDVTNFGDGIYLQGVGEVVPGQLHRHRHHRRACPGQHGRRHLHQRQQYPDRRDDTRGTERHLGQRLLRYRDRQRLGRRRPGQLRWHRRDRDRGARQPHQRHRDRLRRVEQQPDSPEIRLGYAFHLYRSHRDYDRAWVQLGIAKPNLPNSAEAVYLEALMTRRRGDFGKAIDLFNESIKLDPRNPPPISDFGGNALQHATVYRGRESVGSVDNSGS